MSCQMTTPPFSNMNVIARGNEYEEENDLCHTVVYKDHWKHGRTEPPQPPSRQRYTYSPSRTQFDYIPRYEHHPLSLPTSPLSTSGVYSAPPISSHAHYHHSLPYTSSNTSLNSSGGGYAPPTGNLEHSYGGSSLTSSYPSQIPPYSVPPRDEMLRARENQNRRYRSVTAHSSAGHHGSQDWRSMSWSTCSSQKHAAHAHHQHSPLVSAHPLNYRMGVSQTLGGECSPRYDIPSPSSESHLDSSPPTSEITSPRHMPATSGHAFSNVVIDIVSHPQDMCIELGDCIFLRCEARILYSLDRPTYQWYKDEEPLIGEVDSVLRVERTHKDDFGYYFCVVSVVSGGNQRRSSTARVKMAQSHSPMCSCKPLIIDQPDSKLFVHFGERLVLKLLVRAQPEPTYQWFRNGHQLPYASGSELVIPSFVVTDEGQYICSVSNSIGTILSDTYSVNGIRGSSPEHIGTRHTPTLNPGHSPSYYVSKTDPTVNLSPTKKHFNRPRISEELVRFVTSQVCRQIGPGENIEGLRLALGLSQADTDSIRLKYQGLADCVSELIHFWMKTVPHSSISLLEEQLQVYGFRITIPSQYATFAAVSQQGPPVVKVHPENVQVVCGEEVEMFVIVEGTSNMRYQWYKDGIPYPGLINAQVKLTDVQELNTGFYHCCITNSFGSTNSHPARLEVLPALKLQLPPSLYGGKNYGNESQPVVSLAPPGVNLTPPTSLPTSPRCFPISPLVRKADKIPSSAPPISYHENVLVSSLSERIDSMKLENNKRPTIQHHPVSQSLSVGDKLHLTVSCLGHGNAVHYLWFFNGLAMRTEKRDEFTLYCFTEDDVGDYLCEVSNEFGSVMSDKAVISLKPDPDDNN